MSKAFGIINFAGNNIQVNDMQAYRPIGAFSFLGRYRVIDFPISNMSNSGIDVMQVYVRRKPRSLVEHIGTGRHYNINSKRGKLITLFQESNIDNGIYNTDIAAYMENLDCFDEINSEYVVIAPSYMVYTADYSTFLNSHIESGADITLMYHSVDNAKDHFPNCQTLNINKQKLLPPFLMPQKQQAACVSQTHAVVINVQNDFVRKPTGFFAGLPARIGDNPTVSGR